MKEETFLENFVTIFDEVEIEELTMDTEFKNFEEWGSLAALGLLAVMEDEYDVTLTHDDIKGAITVRDIYTIIQKR